MNIAKCSAMCAKYEADIERVISYTEDTYVAVLNNKSKRLLLKLTMFGDVSKEVALMDDARELVPVPKVYEYGEEIGVRFMLMEYVEGSVAMSEYQDELSESLYGELKGIVSRIRSIKRDYSLGDVDDHYLKVCRFGLSKYNNATEFMRARLCGVGLDDCPLPDLTKSELVLSHCDLWPYNVMVSRDGARVTGIIDWQTAGYYPDFYERSTYMFRCRLECLHNVAHVRAWIDVFSAPCGGAIDSVEDLMYDKIVSRWREMKP